MTTSQHEPDLLGARMLVPDSVVYRTFARETVVLNLETGLYHGLNPTAGRMIDVLSQVARVGDAAEILASEYAQPLSQIQTDLCTFCQRMLDRGLLTQADTADSPNGHAIPVNRAAP